MCRYLVGRHGVDGDLRWAIAGRSADKLASVAAATGAAVPRIVADAADRPALDELAESTSVVVSTVGPYALYGSELVGAVVEAGVDYCDLTGEVQWMRRMIDAHQARAEQTGARVVHACGFDSIPSDLGVWFTQQRAIETFGEPCTEVRMSVAGARGGVSGGTAASGINMFEEMANDPELRAITSDPYVLAPIDQRHGPKQPGLGRPTRDARFDSWVAPFVMAPTNSAVVLSEPRAARSAVGEGLHVRRDDDDRRGNHRRSEGLRNDRRTRRDGRRRQLRPDPQTPDEDDPEAGRRAERGQAAGRLVRPPIRRHHRLRHDHPDSGDRRSGPRVTGRPPRC